MSFPRMFLVPSLLFSSLIFSTQSFGYSATNFNKSGGKFTGGARPSLFSASLNAGTTFDRGGSLAVEGDGNNGIPGAVLFPGTFFGSSKWLITEVENGTHNYTLTGEVRGTMSGKSVDGLRMVLTINAEKEHFNGSTSGGEAVVHSASVPEASTFALFGTGAFILTGMLRRKALSTRHLP